jgi:phage terminase large subunit-like protein
MDIYTECLLRTMTTDGLIMVTFTPLNGRTPLVASFLAAQRNMKA